MAENFMGASAAWLRDGSERIEKRWTENNGRNSTGTACAKHAADFASLKMWNSA
jgi:hypothetical protein